MWMMYLLMIILVLIAGVVVPVVVVVSQDDVDSSQDGATKPTISPEPPGPVVVETATPAPTQNLTNLTIAMLSPYFPDLPNSIVQQEALNWLVEYDGEGLIYSGDVDRLLDRYVLALLFIAWNGTEWPGSHGWMTPVSVCIWHLTDGTICPEDDGRVEMIYLCKYSSSGGLTERLQSLPSHIVFLTFFCSPRRYLERW